MDLVDHATIQRRLHKLGYNPGEIDGIRGRKTINAICRFQEANGLVPDGLVGPATFKALFGSGLPGQTPRYDIAPWFDEAIRVVGTQEKLGSGSEPIIIDWAKKLKAAKKVDLKYEDDDIPWCGLFVAYCVGIALPMESIPKIPLVARNWKTFGSECSPQYGSVMVFWRGKRSGYEGHVGFYFGEDSTAYHILGGNQSDTVNVARVDRDRLLASRWPLTGLAPTGEVIAASDTGSLSSKEA